MSGASLFPRPPVLFCDFDGTITLNDNIIAIMKRFDPPGWAEIVRDILDERQSIQQGVGELFALLPSALKPDILAFVLETAGIRPGFAELLAWCDGHGVPFYVTSGGIDFFVLPVLEPFGIPRERIFCNVGDFGGERICIVWPHTCDDNCSNRCGMCKTTVMRRYPPEQYFRILIGDSVTDFAGARLADLVCSRARLTDKCAELGLPHAPFETFYDVIRILERGGAAT